MIELSSGHVFAKGSVKAITPATYSSAGYCELPVEYLEDGDEELICEFRVVGVGFTVEISTNDRKMIDRLRNEAIEKLL